MTGCIVLRFGSALLQEGNPIPILLSICKLHFLDNDYEQFSKTDLQNRYVSENTGEFRFNVVKGLLGKSDWEFKEQMGSGLIFKKDEQTIVIETKQYSKYYILWSIPNEVIDLR